MPNYKPLITSGLLLGIGLGGFVDGILFHQILQTHNMVSARLGQSTVTALEIGMFWDGMFHALTWLATVSGITLLWRAGRRDDVPWVGKVFVSAQLLGWGLFNVVEGIIDHHLLHLHHVVERLGVSVFDYAFLASGGVLILVGWFGIRSGQRTPVDSVSNGHP